MAGFLRSGHISCCNTSLFADLICMVDYHFGSVGLKWFPTGITMPATTNNNTMVVSMGDESPIDFTNNGPLKTFLLIGVNIFNT